MLNMIQTTRGVRRTIIAGLAAAFLASSAIVVYAGACQYVVVEDPAYMNYTDGCADGANYCYRVKQNIAESCMGPAQYTDCNDNGTTQTSQVSQRALCTATTPSTCPGSGSVLWQNIGDPSTVNRADKIEATGCQ